MAYLIQTVKIPPEKAALLEGWYRDAQVWDGKDAQAHPAADTVPGWPFIVARKRQPAPGMPDVETVLPIAPQSFRALSPFLNRAGAHWTLPLAVLDAQTIKLLNIAVAKQVASGLEARWGG